MSRGQGSIPELPVSTPESAVGEAASIWIVTGTTGEYSDRSEWVTCAFWSEADAKAFVEFLGVKRQEIGPEPDDWTESAAWAAKMKVFDPGFQEDYTGTSWYVSEAKLHGSLAEAVQS